MPKLTGVFMGQQRSGENRQTAERQLPKAVAAKSLTDLEIKLLLCLQNTIRGRSAVCSVSELGKTLEAPSADIMSSLTSLEKKGYLRYWRLSKELPTKSFESRELAEAVFEHIIETLAMIDKLLSLQERTAKEVYDKVLKDLARELMYSTRRLAEARRACSKTPKRMKTMIESERKKLAEIRLRMAIGQIDRSEGARLVESYETEIRKLEAHVLNVTHFLPEKSHESTGRQTELEKRLTGVSQEMEELLVRFQVGEITEAQRVQRSGELEEKRQRTVAELKLLADKPRFALADVKRTVRDLADRKILPEKVAARLLPELEALGASTSQGDA
jgi:hypothetical protein